MVIGGAEKSTEILKGSTGENDKQTVTCTGKKVVRLECVCCVWNKNKSETGLGGGDYK